MEHLIIIAQGDTSGDGHEKVRQEFFMSNYSKWDVVLAYDAGCEALGFNPIKALERQEYCLTQEQADKLDSMIPPENEYAEWVAHERISLDLPYLYVEVAQIGNKDVKFKWVPRYEHVVEIGCYDSV